MTPSLSPTCIIDEDFHVCLALDMSGSVCNDGRSNESCRGCGEDCNAGEFDMATCCSNFHDIVEFARTLITAMDEMPTDQTFSLVRFADEAQRVTMTDDDGDGSTTTAGEARAHLDGLVYTGGKTNLKAGLTQCQETFSSGSSRNHKNFIIVITDGAPSLPEPLPQKEALDAADEIKEDGTVIFPVFIDTRLDIAYAEERERDLQFMRYISSDDSVVDVASFEDLDNVRRAMLDQISCHRAKKGLAGYCSKFPWLCN